MRKVNPDGLVFASGGLKNGIDIAKCLALGANLGGMAGVFLKAAHNSLETAIAVMHMVVDQIRVAMFASGTPSLAELTSKKLVPSQQG